MLDALAPSKAWDTDGQLLNALQEGSETLQNITDQFAPLMKRFRIFFFWEQEKTDLPHTRDYVSLLRLTTSGNDHSDIA
jgi:protein SERAC1